MLGPSRGIAQVSYKGGSLYLPARSPYDRELLAEEVLRESHLHGAVQILLDDARWLVHRIEYHTGVSCAQCGQPMDSACHSESHGEALFCVGCALGDELASGHHSGLRAAS